MRNIPKWIDFIFKQEDFYCPICKSGFNKKGIMAMGIRVSLKNIKKEVLFVIYLCFKCKETIELEFGEITIEDFALNILEEMEDNIALEEKENKGPFIDDYEAVVNNSSEEKKKLKKIKSKITSKEIKDVKKVLNGIKSHEDFLLELGFSEEEIDEYRFKKRKK